MEVERAQQQENNLVDGLGILVSVGCSRKPDLVTGLSRKRGIAGRDPHLRERNAGSVRMNSANK